MAKIWRNRIEAGTQKLADCPARYRNDVVVLIQGDIENGVITTDDLWHLVEIGMMTEAEYAEIVSVIDEE